MRRCKAMYATTKEPEVLRRMALEKEDTGKWWNNNRFLFLLEKLYRAGNPEACLLTQVMSLIHCRRRGRVRATSPQQTSLVSVSIAPMTHATPQSDTSTRFRLTPMPSSGVRPSDELISTATDNSIKAAGYVVPAR